MGDMADYYSELELADDAALQSFLRSVEDCDGLEIHKDDWPIAYHLADKGLITLGSPRGPNRSFMRAELVTVPVYTLQSPPPTETPMAIQWNTDPASLISPVCIEIYGPSYTGRTHLALTHRAPIALLHCHERLCGTVNSPLFSRKDIRTFDFASPIKGADDESLADSAMVCIDQFEAAYDDALTWARTVIIDTHTELWEIMRFAYFGAEKPTIVKGMGKEGRMDVVWAGINGRWRRLRTKWKSSTDTDLILIGRSGDLWVNNKATDKQVSKGQKSIPYDADIRIETSKALGGDFSFTYIKPGINYALQGITLPNTNMPLLLSGIYGNTPADWE